MRKDTEMIASEQLNFFSARSYLVLENFVSEQECERLRTQIEKILVDSDNNQDGHRSIFSTVSKDHESDRYFLDSADKIRFFYEKDAFSPDGKLTYPLSQAVNKVGHALHVLDPVFKEFSMQEKFLELCKLLGQQVTPLCIQSMYIFKQARIGGEVTCHQDSTYIQTKSGKLLGMWLALEEANRENGCLWGIPGRHMGQPKSKLIRIGSKLQLSQGDKSSFDLSKLVPIEVKQGSLIVFNGLFPHLSYHNRSKSSRHAYTMHWINGKEDLSSESWLY